MSESGSSRFKYAFVFCIGLGLIETNGTVWPWGAEVCALLSTILVPNVPDYCSNPSKSKI